ncbi:hypothetical protein C8Q77DRAFT_554926 [Trametes polyzona]|nr:hypothetical protein C8Q77DRAFT_554926 [Trametes polyzona]
MHIVPPYSTGTLFTEPNTRCNEYICPCRHADYALRSHTQENQELRCQTVSTSTSYTPHSNPTAVKVLPSPRTRAALSRWLLAIRLTQRDIFARILALAAYSDDVALDRKRDVLLEAADARASVHMVERGVVCAGEELAEQRELDARLAGRMLPPEHLHERLERLGGRFLCLFLLRLLLLRLLLLGWLWRRLLPAGSAAPSRARENPWSLGEGVAEAWGASGHSRRPG